MRREKSSLTPASPPTQVPGPFEIDFLFSRFHAKPNLPSQTPSTPLPVPVGTASASSGAPWVWV